LLIAYHLLAVLRGEFELDFASWFLLPRDHLVHFLLLGLDITRVKNLTQIEHELAALFGGPVGIQHHLNPALLFPELQFLGVEQHGGLVAETFL